MSACILPTNSEYRNLREKTNYDDKTLHSIIQTYWSEHPEKGIEGKESYPSEEYVKSFFDTATTPTESEEVIRLWRNYYRKPVEVKSTEDEQRLREDALQYFNEDAILSYSTKDGKRYIRIARPILKGEDTGFEFNREQKYAIGRISDWLMDKAAGRTTDDWIVLEGEAGTGKTSIINDILLNTLSLRGGNVMVGAVSNQATDNIMDKLSEKVTKMFSIDRKTVAGMLGLKMDNSKERKGFVEDPRAGKPILYADMVIVDEASMVTEQLIELVKQASERGIPVLFIGDEAQVRPIREGEWFDRHKIDKNADAPVFSNRSETEFISLTERVRQGEDSPILDFAHAYRNSWQNNTPLPRIPGRKSSADGRLIFTAKRATELLQDLIPIFQEAIRTNNPNLIHIVPFNRDYQKNSSGQIIGVKPRSALWWNQKIYDALHPEQAGTYILQEGDLVRFDNDYAISDEIRIHNSDNAQVIASGEEQTDIYGVKYRIVTLNWNNKTITVPVVSQDIENQNKFTVVKKALFAKARAKETTYQKVHEYIDSYADVNLSYALNVHRAQGSTYDITVLDQDNIDAAPTTSGYRDNASLGYTAATRAKNVLLVASSKADEKNMKVDLLATNKRFNKARSKKPVTIQSGDSTEASKSLNTPKPVSPESISIVSSDSLTGTLSNFAFRPFIPNIEIRSYSTGTRRRLSYPAKLSFIFNGTREFNTVEGAFQAAKLVFTGTYTKEEINNLVDRFAKATGKEARTLGNSLKDFDSASWDKVSSQIMHNLLWESFRQNKDARTELLATATKSLSHPIPDTGKSDFVGNLTKVRDELFEEEFGKIVVKLDTTLGKAVERATRIVGRGTITSTDKNKGSLPTKGVHSTVNILKGIASGEYDTNATESAKKLAASLIPLVERLGITIKFVDSGSAAGQTYHTRTAEGVDVDLNASNRKIEKIPTQPILHEVTHALTASILRQDREFNDSITEIRNYVTNYLRRVSPNNDVQTKTYTFFNKERQEYVEHVLNFDIYGLETNAEFLAEAMANESFQNVLKEIPSSNNENLSVWKKIVKYVTDAFSRVFKKFNRTDKNVYDELMPVISYVMEVGSYNINRETGEVTRNEVTDEQIKEAGRILQTRDTEVFAGVSESEQTLNSEKTILSNEELKYWNEQGVGPMPRILVATEHTDPIFYAKQIIDVINGNRTVKDYKGNELTGKDFAGLYIITKHDGLPMLDLLQTKIPKLIHFSITTLGGTEFEPGVMKYNDLLDRIEDYIQQGLDPNSVTIRIDPIVPGVTKYTDIEDVVRRASAMGIKRIRFSIMDAYPDTVAIMKNMGYDFEKYYGVNPKARAGYNFNAKQEYLDDIMDFMLTLKDKYDITLGTCAEVGGREGISKEGCLSVSAVNNMLGTHIEDRGINNNNQRQLCSCYGGKVDFLSYNAACASTCVYCYAKHQSDKVLNLYDENGKLKDNNFTRTRREEQKKQAEKTSSLSEVVEKPAGNIETPKTSYVTAELQQSTKDAQKFKSTQLFTPLAENSDGTISADIIENIEKGNFAIGTRIVPDIHGTVEDIIAGVRILNKTVSKRGSFLSKAAPIPASISRFTEEEINRLDKAGIKNDGKNVMIPAYSVGLSEKELSDINKREKLANNKFYNSMELRSIGVKLLWKTSDIITKLQTKGLAASKEFLSNLGDVANVDFTGKDRLSIIREVGIDNLIGAATDALIPYSENDTVLQSRRKQFIRENRDLIVEQAQDFLAKNEEISLKTQSVNKNIITTPLGGQLTEAFDVDGEVEVAELQGSSAEHWMVGFRQVSAISSLSTLVRRNLSNLLELNPDGSAIQEEFGPKILDVHQAVLDMLHWVSGAKDSDEMMRILQERMATHPWLRQLVGEYYEDGNLQGNLKQGILVGEENGQLRSKFFTNFSKYFQPYITMYKDDEGNSRLRGINTNTYSEQVISELKALDSAKYTDHGLTIWDKSGKLSKAFEEFRTIVGYPANNRTGFPATGLVAAGEESTVSDETLKKIQRALNILDIQAPSIEEMRIVVQTPQHVAWIATKLSFIANSIDKLAKDSPQNFTLFGKKNNSIQSDLKALLSFFEPVMSISNEAVAYEAGKMHYGYVQPSYLNLFISELKGNVDDYDAFMAENFLNYTGWFYTPEGHETLAGNGYLNYWIQLLNTKDAKGQYIYRDTLEHVASLSFNGTGYSDKPAAMIGSSYLQAYFYDSHEASAYYRVLLLSNKPSEEYIKFIRLKNNYRNVITESALTQIFMVEVNRIKTVAERLAKANNGILAKDALIASLETKNNNGLQFQFLKFLNDEIENRTPLGQAVLKMLSSDGKISLSNGEHVNLVDLFRTEFNRFMDTRFEEFLNNLETEGTITRDNGEITEVYGIQDLVGIGLRAKENLREFFWNDWFAQVNMFQIFMGDPAQYSNAEDIQKRAAQLHSPGMRPDLAAVDVKTHDRVSDGFERFMVVKDIITRSDVVDALEKIHNRILSDPKYSDNNGKLTALGKQKATVLKRVRDAFEETNWTDGQALISPTGLRKKLHMFGNWTPHMEDVYDKIMSGNFTNADLDVLWPVIKPFSYSQVAKNTHSRFMPFFRMGVQQKDSEFTLILVDALARSVGVDTKFAAFYDVMEETSNVAGQPVPDGIDAILFDSTLKTGMTGALDISTLTPDQIRESLRERMRATGEVDINGQRRMYNPDYVYEIPFRDWAQQQEVPFHFEGKQQMGSQPRALIVSDAADTYRDSSGKVIDNTITVNLNGKNTTMTVKEAKKNYFSLLADNILDSARNLGYSLGIDKKNKQLRNIALSRMLIEELSKDGRYGPDMLRAVSVDKNGNFITPLSDPMLAGTLQQMMNAIIKNRIYKQEVEGGPLVQVSSFGHSEDLKVVCDEETGRPLYAEVLISAPAEWYDIPEFLDENGNLSIDKINAINPKLLEMIGYRIPTEGKYSMLPFKVVGFMSRSSEGIMLPKEITVLSGSDFDVDKLYIMRRAFDRDKSGNISLDTRDIRDNRNNQMLDYAWAFLTSDLCADQTLSAGNFDEEKRVAYTIAAVDNLEDKSQTQDIVNRLKNRKASAIKDIAYKPYDLLFMDTQMKFFKQNMVAAKLIGIFAQSNISHAFISMMANSGKVPYIEISDGLKFTVLDNRGVPHTIGGAVSIDNEYDWSEIKRISTTFAELIGASVDSVKDPVFNLMNVNLVTANVLSTMLRLGWDIESVAWFLTTPVIKELVKRCNLEVASNPNGTANISDIIRKMQLEVLDNKPDKFQEDHAWGRDEFISLHNLEVMPIRRENESNDEFVTRQFQQGHQNWQLLELFARMNGVSDSIRSIIHMTRMNSVASAPGPYAANTLVDRIKAQQFDKNPSLDGVREAIDGNPVLYQFRRTVDWLVDRVLGDNLVQAGPVANSIYAAMQDYYGYISNENAQLMSEFMMSYLVNLNNPVFDTSVENRRYMLLGFPNIFIQARNRYTDNPLLKNISYKTDASGKPFLELNTRGMEDSDMQELKSAWETLYKEEEKRIAKLGGEFKKHENENLALKLVEYNYFRGGLGFSPKTFMRLVPESIKDVLPNYRDNTRRLEGFGSTSIDGRFIQNLLYQFMLNTGKFNMRQMNDLKIQKDSRTGNLFVSAKDAPELKLKGIVPVKKGKTIAYYAVDYEPQSGIYKLQPVQKLGGNNFGFEIDPNIPYYEIKSVFNQTSESTQPDSVSNPSEEDLSSDADFPTQEPSNATIGQMNRIMGNSRSGSISHAVESFSEITEKFFGLHESDGIDNTAEDDNFVMNQLSSINWNLSERETKDMILKAQKMLDEQNICR